MFSTHPQIIAQVHNLQRQGASLLLYQAIFDQEIGQAFLRLLEVIQSEIDELGCFKAYGTWFTAQARIQQSWQDYLIDQILHVENPFTQSAQTTQFKCLTPSLIKAVESDLNQLQALYQCSGEQLSQWLQATLNLSESPVIWQGQKSPEKPEELSIWTQFQTSENWADLVESLADYYSRSGTGLFSVGKAFRWDQGKLVTVLHPDPIQMNQLVGYQAQQNLLIKNTQFLLAGYPAQNVLLYGSRGCGKSSRVKALLQQYYPQGLRLIEVAKSDLKDLPIVVEKLRNAPQKFIIFVDDLSFEDDDDMFKALKVVLEGTVTPRPQNVAVYATSNRRHLVREFFEDRPRPQDHDEIQAWDTVQEKLSFSDRFGLTLTFEPPDQNTYLEIVFHLAQQAGLSLHPEDLKFQALQWATRHNGRSGRTARQFVDFLTAELALS
ncbi:MAG: ATP-binding protein [Oscillatoriales cyanobacterium RM1_1_9]|nr:ATP-binding protein [Oscillatoriales cyanobacterium SM2_3_0]NJO45184.1 ATP-binding protein [Oscillatoriales cyanobacterium RM2_1_1]NJO71284.1 ATP-binding protein [Oscillatoriales cyanobacterium RM1_1_9]